MCVMCGVLERTLMSEGRSRASVTRMRVEVELRECARAVGPRVSYAVTMVRDCECEAREVWNHFALWWWV